MAGSLSGLACTGIISRCPSLRDDTTPPLLGRASEGRPTGRQALSAIACSSSASSYRLSSLSFDSKCRPLPCQSARGHDAMTWPGRLCPSRPRCILTMLGDERVQARARRPCQGISRRTLFPLGAWPMPPPSTSNATITRLCITSGYPYPAVDCAVVLPAYGTLPDRRPPPPSVQFAQSSSFHHGRHLVDLADPDLLVRQPPRNPSINQPSCREPSGRGQEREGLAYTSHMCQITVDVIAIHWLPYRNLLSLIAWRDTFTNAS